MADPETVVRTFFDDTAKLGNLVGALETHMADNCVWTNPGFPDANGIDEMKALMQQFIDGAGLHSMVAEFKALATSGNQVVTERVDYFDDAEGNRLPLSLPVAGTFEVEDGKITAWRDYWDPRPFLG